MRGRGEPAGGAHTLGRWTFTSATSAAPTASRGSSRSRRHGPRTRSRDGRVWLVDPVASSRRSSGARRSASRPACCSCSIATTATAPRSRRSSACPASSRRTRCLRGRSNQVIVRASPLAGDRTLVGREPGRSSSRRRSARTILQRRARSCGRASPAPCLRRARRSAASSPITCSSGTAKASTARTRPPACAAHSRTRDRASRHGAAHPGVRARRAKATTLERGRPQQLLAGRFNPASRTGGLSVSASGAAPNERRTCSSGGVPYVVVRWRGRGRRSGSAPPSPRAAAPAPTPSPPRARSTRSSACRRGR